MIFESLNASNNYGELLLVDGGMCHFHVRRDGVLTIREIIVNRPRQRQGIGRQMIVTVLRQNSHAWQVRLRCPADLEANGFYEHLGFRKGSMQRSARGRAINNWSLTNSDDAWLKLLEAA